MPIAELYTSEEYLKKNPDWHLSASPWKASVVLQAIKRNHLCPQSICEIGCGAGEILKILQTHLEPTCNFRGYDIAPDAIALAKLRENEYLHVFLGDVREDENYFCDLILIIDTLEHFENCFELLRNIKAQSTYKILQLPLDISIKSILNNKLPEYRHATGHLHFFTKDIALEVIRDAGYEVLDCFYAIEPFRGIGIKAYPFPLDQLRTVVRALQRLPLILLYALNKDFAVRVFGNWKLIVLAR
ncbi:MAG TPA: methyltransferase domain-containing protein [Ktedonobacteraceae bacterium]